MDKRIICAYLWQEIIRIGFMPDSSKKVRIWFKEYISSLYEFWGINEYPSLPGGKEIIIGKIDHADLEIWIEYKFQENQHLHLEFNHRNGNIWLHHSDPKYFRIPLETLLDEKMKSIHEAKFENSDLEYILNSMIFHPCEHQHIKSPIDNHKIRIGGGLPNPFLYLFHLRYQLCPFEEKRKAEKQRLFELFIKSVGKAAPLEAKLLMAQP